MWSSTGVTAQYFLKETKKLCLLLAEPSSPLPEIVSTSLCGDFDQPAAARRFHHHHHPPPPPECAGVGRALPLLNTK